MPSEWLVDLSNIIEWSKRDNKKEKRRKGEKEKRRDQGIEIKGAEWNGTKLSVIVQTRSDSRPS